MNRPPSDPPTSDIEARLATWLEEGPTSGPDEVLSSTFARARSTRQDRVWLDRFTRRKRFLTMNSTLKIAAVAAFALVLAVSVGPLQPRGSDVGAAPALAPPFGPAANGLIAFAWEGDIHVVEPDGSGRRPIAVGSSNYSDPIWSRDGTRLAYWSDRPDRTMSDLLVTDAEGSDPVLIAQTSGEETSAVEWSADGTEVMFSEVVPGLGADPCPISENAGGMCGSRLFVAATDGSGLRQVGDPDLDARSPILSPDGTTVAFGGGAAGSASLYLMDWDGSNLRRLDGVEPTGDWAFIHQSWSADGTRIATHDRGDPGQAVWIVEADGSGATKIADMPGYERFPTYSPDGSAILWDRAGSGMRIWSPSDETSHLIPGLSGDTIWSPDSSQLASTAFRYGKLLVFDRDGETIVEIDGADDSQGSWQRLAP